MFSYTHYLFKQTKMELVEMEISMGDQVTMV